MSVRSMSMRGYVNEGLWLWDYVNEGLCPWGVMSVCL